MTYHIAILDIYVPNILISVRYSFMLHCFKILTGFVGLKLYLCRVFLYINYYSYIYLFFYYNTNDSYRVLSYNKSSIILYIAVKKFCPS